MEMDTYVKGLTGGVVNYTDTVYAEHAILSGTKLDKTTHEKYLDLVDVLLKSRKGPAMRRRMANLWAAVREETGDTRVAIAASKAAFEVIEATIH